MLDELGPAPLWSKTAVLFANRFFLAGVLIAVAVGVLIFTRSQVNMVYYKTVAEVLNSGGALEGQQIRVMGRVQDESIQRDDEAMNLRFVLTDGTGTIPVEYQGIVPDMFGYASQGRYQDVVVEGKYGDGRLDARQLIVAHNSEYREANPQSIPDTGR